MAPQPTGDAALTDKDLDEAVESMFADDEAPTAAPESAPEGSPAEEAVAEPETAPDAAEAPAGDARPADVVETRPAEEAAVPAIPAGAKPFQFKASGQVQALPGAHELPDGSVLVTKDAITELRRTFANERDLSRSFQQYRRDSDRKLRDAQTQRTAKDAEAEASIALVAELLQKSPEEQWQYLNELQGNIPKLQLDLERKKLTEQQKLFEEQRKGPQLSEEEQREQFTETVKGELNATFQWIEQDPQFALLTPTERQQLRARWEKKPERLVRRATEDNPAQGITKGDYLFDPSEVVEDIQFLIGNRKASQPSKAAAENARRNADQQVTNRIPPTPKPAAPANLPPRDKTGKFTDRKKFREDFMRDDDDEAA